MLHLVVLYNTPFHCACSAGYSHSREEELVDSLALREEGFRDMQGLLAVCVPFLPNWLLHDCLLCWPVPLSTSWILTVGGHLFIVVSLYPLSCTCLGFHTCVCIDVCCEHCKQTLGWGSSLQPNHSDLVWSGLPDLTWSDQLGIFCWYNCCGQVTSNTCSETRGRDQLWMQTVGAGVGTPSRSLWEAECKLSHLCKPTPAGVVH